MRKIANQLVSLRSWFSSPPMCERDRDRRHIMMTFTDVHFHTPGI